MITACPYMCVYARVPACAGHSKAVSYVRFLSGSQLVTASTDNSLKLWDLNNAGVCMHAWFVCPRAGVCMHAWCVPARCAWYVHAQLLCVHHA